MVVVDMDVCGSVLAWSQAANVGEALELLWEVVLIEHWVSTVFYYLQRHRTKHRCKLVDAFRPRDENTKLFN